MASAGQLAVRKPNKVALSLWRVPLNSIDYLWALPSRHAWTSALVRTIYKKYTWLSIFHFSLHYPMRALQHCARYVILIKASSFLLWVILTEDVLEWPLENVQRHRLQGSLVLGTATCACGRMATAVCFRSVQCTDWLMNVQHNAGNALSGLAIVHMTIDHWKR